MSVTWALHEAKNRLSEVVERANEEGPQTITRRGKVEAVLISIDDYKKLTQAKGDLVTFLRQSPLVGTRLDLERRDDFGRGAVPYSK